MLITPVPKHAMSSHAGVTEDVIDRYEPATLPSAETRQALSPERVEEVIAVLCGPADHYPAQAVVWATEHIDQFEPHLLAVLAAYAADPNGSDARYGGMAPVFAAYVLADARKTAAHALLLSILAAPDEIAFDVFGDVVTEDMSMLLWKTSGGDLSSVLELARNRKADPYCRMAAYDVLPFAWAAGDISRNDAIATLCEVLEGAKSEPDDAIVVGHAVALLADLHPRESLELIREAYELELIDLLFVDWEYVEERSQRDREEVLNRLRIWRLEELARTLDQNLRSWIAPAEERPRVKQGASAVDSQQQRHRKEQERRRRKKKEAKKVRKKNRRKR